MKVVSPLNASHTIILIPRFYPTSTIVLELTEEASNITNTIANSYATTDGLVSINFNYDFTDKDKYSIKVKEGVNVVYRGKLIVTSQVEQEYKQTTGLYYYE